jgi:hypothetical protein
VRTGFKLLEQISGPDRSETRLSKGFEGFVVTVVTNHYTFFDSQQVARVRPLLPCTVRKLVVARVDKRYVVVAAAQIFDTNLP